MAGIGLRYSVYAPLTEDEAADTFTYATGKKGRKTMKADLNLNIAESKLYADDNVAESIREFIDGTLTLGEDELTYTMRTDLLGNTTKTITVGEESDIEELSGSDTDTPGFVGYGYIQSKIIDKVRQYRAVFFTKVQFGEPNESAETKGQSIAWQTPVIVGTIMRRNDSKWKEEITVPALATAIEWLKSKANIT